jgi:hypothetical protein
MDQWHHQDEEAGVAKPVMCHFLALRTLSLRWVRQNGERR